jgi:hypothetical protein
MIPVEEVAPRVESAFISGVTVLTHSYQIADGENSAFGYFLSASPGDAMRPLAMAIHQQTGGFLLDYDIPEASAQGQIDLDQSILPSERAIAGNADGLHAVVLFDWAPESNEFSSGWAEAAGDALFNLLVRLGLVDPSTQAANPDLHFIGHGFGAVVTSEAVERLAAYGVPVDQVTFLDPHDFDQLLFPSDASMELWTSGRPAGYGATVWNNVKFADAYIQTQRACLGHVLLGNGAQRIRIHAAQLRLLVEQGGERGIG